MEAKHRRVPNFQIEDGHAHQSDGIDTNEQSSSDGIAEKRPRSCQRSLQDAFLCVIRFLNVRYIDCFFVPYYWGFHYWAYCLIFDTFLPHIPFAFPWLLVPVYYISGFSAIVSWLTVVYVGPGYGGEFVKPTAGPSPHIVAFLNVGRHSERPFDGKESWCDTCNACKPALVHHCKCCLRCVVWMDHHCNFTGTCIGFLNLRAYMVWLVSGMVMHFVWVFLTLLRMFCLLPVDRWEWLTFGLWIFFLYQNIVVIHKFYVNTAYKIRDGWPSHVLLTKYHGLCDAACDIREALTGLMEQYAAKGWETSKVEAALAEIHRGFTIVSTQSPCRVQGLFPKGDFTFVFGEPFSWKWLVPFLLGGTGDPLNPAEFNIAACEAWVEFGDILDKAVALRDDMTNCIGEEDQSLSPAGIP